MPADQEELSPDQPASESVSYKALRINNLREGYEKLPEHMRGAMQRYIEDGIEPGSFLEAVLCNDLTAAFGRADHINRDRLFDYASFLHNHAPLICWGSRETYLAWIKKGGLNGRFAGLGPKNEGHPPQEQDDAS